MNVIEKPSFEHRMSPWGSELPKDRASTERAAHQLSVLAMRQWERALTGTLALPAAVALGAAASVMYVVAVVERIFETAEFAVSEIGRGVVRVDEDTRGSERRQRDGERAADARS
jgi:hypothetical protein